MGGYLIIVLGGGRFALKTFLVFLLLNSIEKLILCPSCVLCNVWMNTFDFIGISKSKNVNFDVFSLQEISIIENISFFNISSYLIK